MAKIYGLSPAIFKVFRSHLHNRKCFILSFKKNARKTHFFLVVAEAAEADQEKISYLQFNFCKWNWGASADLENLGKYFYNSKQQCSGGSFTIAESWHHGRSGLCYFNNRW